MKVTYYKTDGRKGYVHAVVRSPSGRSYCGHPEPTKTRALESLLSALVRECDNYNGLRDAVAVARKALL